MASIEEHTWLHTSVHSACISVYCEMNRGSAPGVSHNYFLAGPVSLSTPAQLIAPSIVMKGTLSVTSFELYFEVDEDDPNFKKIDSKVRERADPCLAGQDPMINHSEALSTADNLQQDWQTPVLIPYV